MASDLETALSDASRESFFFDLPSDTDYILQAIAEIAPPGIRFCDLTRDEQSRVVLRAQALKVLARAKARL